MCYPSPNRAPSHSRLIAALARVAGAAPAGEPETLNPKQEVRNPKTPKTRHPTPENSPKTRNPKPGTRSPKPETRKPKPETLQEQKGGASTLGAVPMKPKIQSHTPSLLNHKTQTLNRTPHRKQKAGASKGGSNPETLHLTGNRERERLGQVQRDSAAPSEKS